MKGWTDIHMKGRTEVHMKGQTDVHTKGRTDVHMKGRSDVQESASYLGVGQRRKEGMAGEQLYTAVIPRIRSSRSA